MTANGARLFALFLLLAGSARSQEGAPPVPPEVESRWSELTPEEKARVRRRYRRFQQMSAEERAAVRDRHDSLKKARKDVLRALDAGEIERLDRLPPGERERAMRPYVKEYLEQSRKSVLASAGLPETAPAAHAFRDLRRAIKTRAVATLKEYEEDGYLEAGQAERLMNLSPWKMRRELQAIQKRHFLQNPPRQFLMLPEPERNELIELPPDKFLRRVHELQGQSRRGPKRLPALMEDLLRGRPRRPRPVPERAIFQALTLEQREQVSALTGPERNRRVQRYLRANAARLLKAQGLDPAQLERLRDLPPVEQIRRLIRIIDPHREGGRPGRPGRANRPDRQEERGERPRNRKSNRRRL